MKKEKKPMSHDICPGSSRRRLAGLAPDVQTVGEPQARQVIHVQLGGLVRLAVGSQFVGDQVGRVDSGQRTKAVAQKGGGGGGGGATGA